MRAISVCAADDVYACARKYKLGWGRVRHDKFRNFCIALSKFEKSVGEDIEDKLWRTFLSRQKRYRLRLCAVPVAFDTPEIVDGSLMSFLEDRIALCRALYPQHTESARVVFDLLANVRTLHENPLLDYIAAMSPACAVSRIGLVIKEARYIPAVEHAMADYACLRKAEVLTPHELRGGGCYDHLIVVGPTYLFPEYVFTSPRAQRIDVVRYNWLKETKIRSSAFIGSRMGGDPTVSLAQPDDDIVNGSRRENILGADELAPTIDWNRIMEGLRREGSPVSQLDDVRARLFLLDGDMAVLLEAEDRSRVLVIDLDADEGRQVCRVPTADIEPGMFVLLRTEGGGDYVVPVADIIMKEHAPAFRGMQGAWKRRLKELVLSGGLGPTAEKLQRLGAPKANPINLRNWISQRNIRPASLEDFAAIMKLIGWAEKTEECWGTMAAIDTAHRMAGQRIRKMLLKQVRSSDLTDLQRAGKREFELPGADAGSITAFRVIGVSPEVYETPGSQIAQPFGAEEGPCPE